VIVASGFASRNRVQHSALDAADAPLPPFGAARLDLTEESEIDRREPNFLRGSVTPVRPYSGPPRRRRPVTWSWPSIAVG
jgi:hypothetical protein